MPDSVPDLAPPLLLYVEDEWIVQGAVVASLEEAGFAMVAASTGEQALELLNEHCTALRGLITDVNLGTGPDGWEVARAARRAISGLPVVYVSAASDREWTAQGVPCSTMIAKPFAHAQLVVAISALMAASDFAG